MNTIFSCLKRLFSNLLCVVLLVVLIVSWQAAVLCRENIRNISVEAKNKIAADQKCAKAMQNISVQKKRQENWCKEINTAAAQKKFVEWAVYVGYYINSEIVNYKYQKDAFEALTDCYSADRKLTIAKSRMYLNFWEEEFRKNWGRYFVMAFLTVFFTPLLIALIMYYGIAFFVERSRADVVSGSAVPLQKPRMDQADARVGFTLQNGCHLFLRAGWCKERKNVVSKTKLLWQWRYPLVSLAADLCELVDFSPEKGKAGEVIITAPIEDMFIGKIELNNSELVIRPRFLVGVTGDVMIRTHWDFSVHSIFSGRIRKIILHGSGTVFLAGSWGVDQRIPQAEEDYRIESRMLLGYDSGAYYSLCRTETFWHYFRGKADLFDIKIRKGMFLTQNNAWSAMREPKNNVDAVLKFAFDGIFSLLGL